MSPPERCIWAEASASALGWDTAELDETQASHRPATSRLLLTRSGYCEPAAVLPLVVRGINFAGRELDGGLEIICRILGVDRGVDRWLALIAEARRFVQGDRGRCAELDGRSLSA